MGRRNYKAGVKGPSSALTEFLKQEGITDRFRNRREIERNGGNQSQTSDQENSPPPPNQFQTLDQQQPEKDDDDDDVSLDIIRSSPTPKEESDDEEIKLMRKAAKRKLKARRGGTTRKNPDSSDDDSHNDLDGNYSSDEDDLGNANLKKFGELDQCIDCGKSIQLTVYSRFIKEKVGYLCDECNQILKNREKQAKQNQLNARKKRKRTAQALLNKTTIKLPKLQDVCIKKITSNITDVDALGDIGQLNLDKISMILSKNRSLNDQTMTLFLSPELKSLSFWDCSDVDSDSLNKIAAFCPNLKSLTLFMCGQLHNDNLQYFATNLKNLKEFRLNGPFLISAKMWIEYFNIIKDQLNKFELRNTHRFTKDSLTALLENCGKKLTSLKLSRLDGLVDQDVYNEVPEKISSNSLTHLEISYPPREECVTDDTLIKILEKCGESLISLNVDGCIGLTDKFLIEGVCKYCINLQHLSMRQLDQVTNEGFSQAFDAYSKINAGGLIEVDLTKCDDIGDEAIYSLLNHSSHTLVELSINSLYRITKDFLSQIFIEDHTQFKKQLKARVEKEKESRSQSQPQQEGEDEEEEEAKDVLHYYHYINLPLLTYLDAGFVRAVTNYGSLWR
ncbi:unnamed protein product [Candida verbasci]|uniref:DNA repair protein rhp7 treble clef domain-containing protein n=1 Tax=Candida verbasci TaxID=1227364 RepID=A0A9W4XFG1_9ASCO|nr:unnamed protein product [Candida verbasci]